MTRIDFDFGDSAWELTRDSLKKGGSISAARFLTLMEGESEDAVQEALQDLQERRILLDLADLPRLSSDGEAAVRLRREQQLVQQGSLTPDSYVWTAGMPQWAAASSRPDLASLFGAVPPPPPPVV